MASVKIDAFVDAPQDTTFAVFSDIGRWRERLGSVIDVELLSAGAPRAGFRWRETRYSGVAETDELLEIGEFEPPDHFTLMLSAPGAVEQARFDFTREESGTRVTLTYSATLERVFFRIMAAMTGSLSPSRRRAMARDLADLKIAAEIAASE